MKRAIALLGMTLCSCASATLNQNAQQVQPIVGNAGPSCKYLGMAKEVHRFGFNRVDNDAGAIVLIRNRVAEMGGNRYRVLKEGDEGGAAWLTADVYSCP